MNTIIVRSEHQSDFESHYINELIIPKVKKINVNTEEFFDLEQKLIKDSKIIIICSPGNQKVKKDINNFIIKFDSNYTLIHLSDESLIEKDYHYEKADLVIRSYFNPSIKHKNAYTIPVGYQNGFYSSQKSDNKKNKKLKWVFFGQIYSTRNNMINELTSIKPNYVFETKNFFSSKNLNVSEMQSIYGKAIFAPSPFGFLNPDTFRIMESLESGCIPIVQKFMFIDYYKYVFGNHPFIVIKKWKEAPEIINNFMMNEAKLKMKQKEISEWYKIFKHNLSKDLSNLIENKNEPLSSKQFTYQKQNLMNLFRRLVFFYWFKFRKYYLFIKLSKFIYRLKRRLKN